MNKKDYKEAVENIKADEKLKEETYKKMISQKKSHIYQKLIAVCAVFLVVLSVTYVKLDNDKENIVQKPKETIAKEEINLPTFETKEELKEYLKKQNNRFDNILENEIAVDTVTSQATNSESLKSAGDSVDTIKDESTNDYSKTNTQVEGVDEADIIKTDGKYIYYIAKNGAKNKIIIIDKDTLKILDKIDDLENEAESITPIEIFIKDNKLIVLANKWKYSEEGYSKNSTSALIFDTTNKEDIKFERNIEIAGTYLSSRMIGDNLYFIAQRSVYYTETCKDTDIMPIYKDTAISETKKCIPLNRIYYFPETDSNSYISVTGVNVNSKEEANIETFLGASSEIYSSEDYLYLTKTDYRTNILRRTSTSLTEIYKLKLEDSKISFKAKAEINGYINDQFSMDEYDGNLRIATTAYDKDGNTTNNLYILDENLKELGSIENMAKNEKIYSVRFIGKTGYIVTFKQVDPLFVIDLSNPEKPEIKGELKIPGYSSYLHPYDDTHIIGIGRNTEETTYGSTVNTNMKMSMFDIADLENPKEMFSVSIGGRGTYSEILSNHKALFFNKEKNLIGFPITIYEEEPSKSRVTGAIIYEINLNEGFIEKGVIESSRNTSQYYSYNYDKEIKRIIYIDDKIYAFSNEIMKVVNMDTLQEIGKVEY